MQQRTFAIWLPIIVAVCLLNWLAWFIDSVAAGGMPPGGPVTWYQDAISTPDNTGYVVSSHGMRSVISGHRYRILCWHGVIGVAGGVVGLVSLVVLRLAVTRPVSGPAETGDQPRQGTPPRP